MIVALGFGNAPDSLVHHADTREQCTSDRASVQATADRSLDLSLADLVDRVLPLATNYVRVVRFIEMREHHEFGLVNHALCAALQVRSLVSRSKTALGGWSGQIRTVHRIE